MEKRKINPTSQNFMIEWRKELLMRKRERINSNQINNSNTNNGEFKIPEPPIKRKTNANDITKQ